MHPDSGFHPFDSGIAAGDAAWLGSPDPSVLRALLDAIPARVIVVDRSLRYRYANAESLDLWGLTADQVVGRPVHSVIGQDRLGHYQPLIERVFSGEAVRWEGWSDAGRKGRRFTQEYFIPYRPPGSSATEALIGFGRDLTELKTRELELAEQAAALQRSEAIKAAIIDCALAAVITTDHAGRIVEFNPMAEQLFQRSRGEVLGLPALGVVIPERHRSIVATALATTGVHAAKASSAQKLWLRGLRAGGEEFPMEVMLASASVGGAVYYVASIVDITERIRAESVIARQHEALRQSERLNLVGAVMARVTHQLNNPLAIVVGRCGQLEERAAGTDFEQDVQRIRTAAQRCDSVVRSFMTFANPRSPRPERLSINALCTAAKQLVQGGLEGFGIELRMQLDPELPEVWADAAQLGQAILALVLNAERRLESLPGARVITLLTRLDSSDCEHPRIQVRVSDSGKPFGTTELEHLFQPLTDEAVDIGTLGANLATARVIAQALGGDMTVGEGMGGATLVLRLRTGPYAPCRNSKLDASRIVLEAAAPDKAR